MTAHTEESGHSSGIDSSGDWPWSVRASRSCPLMPQVVGAVSTFFLFSCG